MHSTVLTKEKLTTYKLAKILGFWVKKCVWCAHADDVSVLHPGEWKWNSEGDWRQLYRHSCVAAALFRWWPASEAPAELVTSGNVWHRQGSRDTQCHVVSVLRYKLSPADRLWEAEQGAVVTQATTSETPSHRRSIWSNTSPLHTRLPLTHNSLNRCARQHSKQVRTSVCRSTVQKLNNICYICSAHQGSPSSRGREGTGGHHCTFLVNRMQRQLLVTSAAIQDIVKAHLNNEYNSHNNSTSHNNKNNNNNSIRQIVLFDAYN